MNTIFAKRRARLLAMKAIRDNYIPGDQLVACPGCGRESQRKDVSEGLSVCPLCGYHFPIGAYYRLSTILDPGSFRELNPKLPAGDPLSFPGYREKQRAAQRKTGLNEAAVTATGGDVLIKNVIPKHLESISAKLLEIGCELEESDDAVRVVASKPLGHTHVKTLPYPGFPTDMQPQITVALGLSGGTSIVTESIFENRFKYVDELTRMGANIKVESNTAIIDGVEKYTGASISAPDLRAGAALVIAALAAEGTTTIDDIQYIERGYEDFDLKLQSLGAQIEKISTERELQKFKLRVV